MKKEFFGVCADGRKASIYTIGNSSGLTARISDFGGVVVNLFVRDKDGNERDVVLGYDTLAEYEKNPCYFGALIGRCGNRIGRGRFSIDGTEYQLDNNERVNHLHGGFQGFDKKLWHAEQTENSLKLTLLSPDGDQKYPGNLVVCVVYTVTNDNALEIRYRGLSDQKTIFNMTNHAYFNLGGQDEPNILGHVLRIDADAITAIDEGLIPTGELMPVNGTPFDFRTPKKIGRDIGADHAQIKVAGGFDHNYALCSGSTAAEAFCEASGISMTVYTDLPGIQLYTGNFLDENVGMKGNRRANKNRAFCLEMQYFPDAVNHSNFESPVIEAGQCKEYYTRFEFSIR